MALTDLYSFTGSGFVTSNPGIDVYDTTTDTYSTQIVYTADTSAVPLTGCFAPDDSFCYVVLTGSTSGVAKVNTTTGLYTGTTLAFPSDALSAICLSKDGTKLFALGRVLNNLYEIDPTALTLTNTLSIVDQSAGGSMTINPNNATNYIWIWSNSTSQYEIVDPASFTSVTTVTSGSAGAIAFFNADGSKAFTTQGANFNPTWVDTSSYSINLIDGSRNCGAIALDGSNRAWYWCGFFNTTRIYDGSTVALITSFTSDPSEGNGVLNPSKTTIYSISTPGLGDEILPFTVATPAEGTPFGGSSTYIAMAPPPVIPPPTPTLTLDLPLFIPRKTDESAGGGGLTNDDHLINYRRIENWANELIDQLNAAGIEIT